jgi:hypothetical protein
LSPATGVIVALIAENPNFDPMYRDQRIALGLYDGEEPSVVAKEIRSATRLMARTLANPAPDQYALPCVCKFPTRSDRSVAFLIQNLIHELRHHAQDIRDSERRTSQ